jgi:2-amino-4-hydroxy-6-hydroxymethyldihydropteridine diphosphokinase
MHEVFVGLGSNFERESALTTAVRSLVRHFGTVVCSSVYKGPATGAAAPDYFNLVAKVVTDLDATALRVLLGQIETATGRTRTDPRVCRLDLDLLAHGGRVDATQRVPRPGLYTVDHVLAPLAEIAPEFAHPLTGERSAVALVAAAPRSRLTNLGSLAALRA